MCLGTQIEYTTYKASSSKARQIRAYRSSDSFGGSIPSLGTKIPRNPQGTMCPWGFFIAYDFMVAGPFLDQGALGEGLKAVQLTFGASPGTE